MRSPLLNILAGLLAGLICACGGAIKDAPYEGFDGPTFLRSPIVGTFCGFGQTGWIWVVGTLLLAWWLVEKV